MKCNDFFKSTAAFVGCMFFGFIVSIGVSYLVRLSIPDNSQFNSEPYIMGLSDEVHELRQEQIDLRENVEALKYVIRLLGPQLGDIMDEIKSDEEGEE